MLTVLAVLAGYLVGSIPSGVLFTRSSGIDLRRIGSGNIGATNVARTVGARAGLLTLAADILKGFVPTYLARYVVGDSWEEALVGVGTVLGHVYPVFARFRGGKGVATAFGAFLALTPLAALASLVTFSIGAAATRYVSVASLIAALTLPVASGFLHYAPGLTLAAIVVAGIVVVRHRDNLHRLRAGTEESFRVAKSGPGF